MQITNNTSGPKSVNTVNGQVTIEAGATATASVYIREKAAIDAAGLTVSGTYTSNPQGLPSGVDADSILGDQYLGCVANKTGHPLAFLNTNKQFGGRLTMHMMDDVSSFQLVYANWYTDNGTSGEKAPGAALNIKVAIEYPIGNATRTQVTWGGVAQGVIPDKTTMVSDPINIVIPRGAKFAVWCFCESTAGMLYVGGANIPFADIADGDTFQYAPSGLTDKTLSGTYTNTDGTAGFAYPPVAVIGLTRRPSIAIGGDSRFRGILDNPGDNFRYRGEIEPSVGPAFAYMQLSQASENANVLSGSGGALRRAMINAYASHFVCNYGVNRLASGAATMVTETEALFALITVPSIIQATLPPVTTSSDSWATLANQTATANEAARVSFNTTVRRRGLAGQSGVLDVADVVESSRNSGKWNVAYTTDPSQYVAFDGIHETNLACQAIKTRLTPIIRSYRRGAIPA